MTVPDPTPTPDVLSDARPGWDEDGMCNDHGAFACRRCASTPPASEAPAIPAGDGQDRKFAFRDGQFVNRISREPIPYDEPVIIFRARDHHALQVLRYYHSLVLDDHHDQAVQERIAEFQAFKDLHPERMKEPGVTQDIRLNDPTPPALSEQPAPSREEVERLRGALRSIAEGNIGNAPWQAGYARIKQVAAAALQSTPVEHARGEEEEMRLALQKARDWLDAEDGVMGPAETASYNRLMRQIGAALSTKGAGK